MSSSQRVVLIALAIVVAAMLAVVQAAPQVVGGYEFPDSAESLLQDALDTSFTCEGLDYGYYADINNNCQIFHVCQPVLAETGEVLEYNQWSFICGNQTVFDQSTLACSHPEDAIPCQDSLDFYNQVEYGLKLDQE